MTDEQLEQVINEMILMFGELPNPEHEPIRFASFVKMYKYYKERQLTPTVS